MMFTKVIVVVDADVDVRGGPEVVWRALTAIDPERDLEIAHGPVDELDFASRLPCYGSKIGFDATRKWKEEGFQRPWPDPIVMSAGREAKNRRPLAVPGHPAEARGLSRRFTRGRPAPRRPGHRGTHAVRISGLV